MHITQTWCCWCNTNNKEESLGYKDRTIKQGLFYVIVLFYIVLICVSHPHFIYTALAS